MRRRPAPRLTREHREALRLAIRLQASDCASAAEDRRELLRYWYGSGATHLRAEETLLINAWGQHGGGDHPLNAAMRADLARLSEAVAALAAAPETSPGTLRAVGRGLAAHVHRQERELFRAVERILPRVELEDVERELEQLRRGARA